MATPGGFDVERERGAEARARELLGEVAGEQELDAYDAFGFISFQPQGRGYGYLLYPHRPIVVFDSATEEPLGEWCVRFRDEGEPLPPADDVLAKWLSLSANEQGLAERANVDPLGTQIDPGHVRRDIARLGRWRSLVSK
ncbi:hypothetical protein BH10ACT11_BH10ACT11_20000 [soil metagenome]